MSFIVVPMLGNLINGVVGAINKAADIKKDQAVFAAWAKKLDNKFVVVEIAGHRFALTAAELKKVQAGPLQEHFGWLMSERRLSREEADAIDRVLARVS